MNNNIYGFLMGVFIKHHFSTLIIILYFIYSFPLITFLPGMFLGIIVPISHYKVKYINYYQIIEKTPKMLRIKGKNMYIRTKYNKNFNCKVGNIITGKLVTYKSINHLSNCKVVYNKELSYIDRLRFYIIEKYSLLAELIGLKNDIFPILACNSLKMIFLLNYSYKLFLHILNLLPNIDYINTHIISTILATIIGYIFSYLHYLPWNMYRILLFFIIRAIIFIPYIHLIELTFILHVISNSTLLFNRSFMLSFLSLILIYEKYNDFQIILSIITGKFHLLNVLMSYRRNYTLIVNIFCYIMYHIFQNYFFFKYIFTLFSIFPNIYIHYNHLFFMMILIIVHIDLTYKKYYSYYILLILIIKYYLY